MTYELSLNIAQFHLKGQVSADRTASTDRNLKCSLAFSQSRRADKCFPRVDIILAGNDFCTDLFFD